MSVELEWRPLGLISINDGETTTNMFSNLQQIDPKYIYNEVLLPKPNIDF